MARYPRSIDRPPRLDVGARAEDVRRIARTHGAWRACVKLGWDPEDLHQEVLLRVHRRQVRGGKSAYDPVRAGVGKYLHLCTRSLLLHILDATESEGRGGEGGRLARERPLHRHDVMPGGDPWGCAGEGVEVTTTRAGLVMRRKGQ